MRLVAMRTAANMQAAWMASCPKTERARAGWKMEGRGSTGERESTGRAKEKAMEAMERRTPEAISWVSEEREPSRDRTWGVKGRIEG
jgi:hypothetical protein